MKSVLTLLAFLLAVGATAQTNEVSSNTNEISQTMQEQYDWWNPTNAVSRANGDIVSGEIRIYYEGTIAGCVSGISDKDYQLVKDYPIDGSGMGCIMVDEKLRKLQNEYGRIYNQRIVEWIKNGKKKIVEYVILSSTDGKQTEVEIINVGVDGKTVTVRRKGSTDNITVQISVFNDASKAHIEKWTRKNMVLKD